MKNSDSLRVLLRDLQAGTDVSMKRLRAIAPELLDLAVVSEKIIGRRKIAHIIDEQFLSRLIDEKFPGGLNEKPTTGLEGILLRGDTKSRKNTTKAIVAIKAIGNHPRDCWLQSVSEYTSKFGVAAITLPSEFQPVGKVVIVENPDVFVEADVIFPDAGIIIYSAGVLDSRVIEWLSQSSKVCEIIHAGDYDPTGLFDFIRLEESCNGINVEFFTPNWLQSKHFMRYGNRKLITRKGVESKWKKVLAHKTEDVGFNKTREWILESNLGLEQEILLLSLHQG